MAYDINGEAYDPRERKEEGKFLLKALMAMGLAALLFFAGWQAAMGSLPEEEEPKGPTMDMLSQTYTSEAGNPIRAYVIIDPDTGYHYIVTDRGGICRREGIDW